MNRAGYRQLLQERGGYGDARSSNAVNVLMELQYYATKQIVGKLTKATGLLTADLVSTIGDQHFGRKNLPSSFDKDSVSAVNSQSFPELKNINAPPSNNVLKYEVVKIEDQMSKITAPVVTYSAPDNGGDTADAHYPERKADMQVSFEVATKDVPIQEQEEDFSKKLLMSDDDDDDDDDADDDDGGDRKRIRI
jgi:hypothetical protein